MINTTTLRDFVFKHAQQGVFENSLASRTEIKYDEKLQEMSEEKRRV